MDEHPDAEEINRMLDAAQQKLDQGFEVTFAISQYDAEILIDCWKNAQEGDNIAVAMLLLEMGKLVAILTEEIMDLEDDYEDEEG